MENDHAILQSVVELVHQVHDVSQLVRPEALVPRSDHTIISLELIYKATTSGIFPVQLMVKVQLGLGNLVHQFRMGSCQLSLLGQATVLNLQFRFQSS